jgi:hypothetical protein
MGGQACVFYGGAEFSRDTDIAVLADPDNLRLLTAALKDLQAECIAVPPFSADYLRHGHAVHFRCRHAEAPGMRLDVMSVMRGVAPFAELWPRRTTVEDPSGMQIELIGLPDLVCAKKTQRDKDWPMIRRLIEAHYRQRSPNPSPEQVEFWLLECRTPAILVELAGAYGNVTASLRRRRPLLSDALAGDEPRLAELLLTEEAREREADRAYWKPLKEELEQLRHQKRGP